MHLHPAGVVLLHPRAATTSLIYDFADRLLNMMMGS
jgi:hypothetical protein